MASNSGRGLATVGGNGGRQRGLPASGLFAGWTGSRCPASHRVRHEQSQHRARPAGGAPSIRWDRSGVVRGGQWVAPDSAWLNPRSLLAIQMSASQRIVVEQWAEFLLDPFLAWRARTLREYSGVGFGTPARDLLLPSGAHGRHRSSSTQSNRRVFLPPPPDPASGRGNRDSNTGGD